MQNKDLNIVVIGASGSLGSEFIRQLSGDGKIKSIFAFSRSVTEFNDSKVESFFIDIEDEESIKSAANKASKDVKIDMVIVATGMLHDANINPEKSLRDLSKEKFHQF